MPAVCSLLFPALLLSAATPGAELRKCVAASGAVSYQSVPCAEGSRQAWVQPVKADPAPTKRAAPLRGSATERRSSRSATRKPSPPRPTARERRNQRCTKAREEAAALRDRLWNKLSFQERSDLDAKVARACGR